MDVQVIKKGRQNRHRIQGAEYPEIDDIDLVTGIQDRMILNQFYRITQHILILLHIQLRHVFSGLKAGWLTSSFLSS
jgi:hypothetical protein